MVCRIPCPLHGLISLFNGTTFGNRQDSRGRGCPQEEDTWVLQRSFSSEARVGAIEPLSKRTLEPLDRARGDVIEEKARAQATDPPVVETFALGAIKYFDRVDD